MSRSRSNPPLSPIAEHPEGNEETPAQAASGGSLSRGSRATLSTFSSSESGSNDNSNQSNSRVSNRGSRRRAYSNEPSTAVLSQNGPNQARQGKTRRNRRRLSQRKPKKKVNFNRFIRWVFNKTFDFYHGGRDQNNRSASPAEKVKVNPHRPPSGISKRAMSVLDNLVKDLITRFTDETNQLLDNSPFVTLDAPEAIGAVQMMINHNIDELDYILDRFDELSVNMPTRRRPKS